MSAPIEAVSTRLRHLWKRRQWLILTALLLAAVILSLSVFLLSRNQEKEVFGGLPHLYSYLEQEGPGQVLLHMMAVSPDNVRLQAADTPLRQVAAYGINGGFFYGDDLLSIALMNDVPVNGAAHAYGSGWFNAKYPRGTLVWDGRDRRFSVQVVSSGDEIAVSDRTHYFAQGGISMNLEHDDLWEAAAAAEHLPFADEQRLRSGMVYDNNGKLWLIVTPSLCTAAEFRTAIQQSVPGEGREGIFLDGDGSSQMNASEVVLTGDARPIVQMIAVAGDKDDEQ